MKVGDTIASKYFSKMIAKIVELKENNCAIVVIGLRKCEVNLNHWVKVEEWSDAG